QSSEQLPAKPTEQIVKKQDFGKAYKTLHLPRFTTTQTGQLITHSGYTVSYSKQHKIAHWVGYELTRQETQGKGKRTDRFVADPFVKGCVTHTSDYTNSGYDRGHLAPAADMKWSADAMKESFYLSNISPQHPNLNRGRWKELEEKVRHWAVSDSAVVVVCGPLIGSSKTTIGKNRITVPQGFFKVVLSPFVATPQAIGFVFKNESATQPLQTYIVSVDSIEKLTGLDFFHTLPDSLEEAVEAKVNKRYWGFK
ncbi:DNA/RNA non-specific endonuclease, partial [Bacteroides sp. OttesenSCG-928-F21]|nr:DNA/RNA non-specific endonuclease [Bacteroides sp. OttesenSCG-928-F21]